MLMFPSNNFEIDIEEAYNYGEFYVFLLNNA